MSLLSKCTLFFCLLVTLLSVSAVPAPNAENQAVGKRSWFGTGTWFHVGLGNCGNTNVDSDWIVAVPTKLYENGQHCGKSVSIRFGDKIVQAWVGDSCPSCGDNDLDMSPSLFQAFSDLGKGVLDINWWFND